MRAIPRELGSPLLFLAALLSISSLFPFLSLSGESTSVNFRKPDIVNNLLLSQVFNHPI